MQLAGAVFNIDVLILGKEIRTLSNLISIKIKTISKHNSSVLS